MNIDDAHKMTSDLSARSRWLIVVLFAVAMAWLEAATVYYLRLVVGRLEPWQPDPLPLAGVAGQVELAREAATLVMLVLVGVLAGRTRRARIGYFAVAFGVWDIGYYAFLKVIYGWPRTLFDWDVLFLLPLPWWGPVIAPAAIATLMIVWGTFLTGSFAAGRKRSRGAGRRVAAFGTGVLSTPAAGQTLYAMGYAGIALALYVFMADAIGVVRSGGGDVAAVLPTRFDWPMFAVALALMAAPVAYEGLRSVGGARRGV